MAKQKYRFVVEKIYRKSVELEINIVEARKNNPKYIWLNKTDVLISEAEKQGCYDGDGYTLDEQNVRAIYNADGEEIYYV